MTILLLQKPEVLERQRAEVEGSLASLEGVRARFATSPSEARRYPETEVVIAPTLPWLPEALEGLPAARWIHFLGAGVDRIWSMDADWSRYRLSKSVGVHASAISEYVLGAVLYVLKGFGRFGRQQQRREWSRLWLDECEGKTLGIIGIGSAGARLAQQAGFLGMTVVGTVATPRNIAGVDAVYGPGEVDRVLEVADFVVLLVPLTDATRGLIDEKALESMREHAWLINVARGEVVDEGALAEALRTGTIGGAVLDVFEDEPLPVSSPLWDLENLLITPHVAGTTQHYMARALDVFKENYRRFVDEGQLVTPVFIERGY